MKRTTIKKNEPLAYSIPNSLSGVNSSSSSRGGSSSSRIITPVQGVRIMSKSQSQIIVNSTSSKNSMSSNSNNPPLDVHSLLDQVEETAFRLEKLCKSYQIYLDSPSQIPNSEALGQIQTTLGKARLLINQKLNQFKNLCIKNLSGSKEADGFRTQANDLAGFWDMCLIQVYEVYSMFENLDALKSNHWRVDKNKVEIIKVKVSMEKEQVDEFNARIRAREEATKKRMDEAKANKKSSSFYQY
jgi:hypothetical protein